MASSSSHKVSQFAAKKDKAKKDPAAGASPIDILELYQSYCTHKYTDIISAAPAAVTMQKI